MRHHWNEFVDADQLPESEGSCTSTGDAQRTLALVREMNEQARRVRKDGRHTLGGEITLPADGGDAERSNDQLGDARVAQGKAA